jgi:hypothetical protein
MVLYITSSTKAARHRLIFDGEQQIPKCKLSKRCMTCKQRQPSYHRNTAHLSGPSPLGFSDATFAFVAGETWTSGFLSIIPHELSVSMDRFRSRSAELVVLQGVHRTKCDISPLIPMFRRAALTYITTATPLDRGECRETNHAVPITSIRQVRRWAWRFGRWRGCRAGP